MTVTEGVSELLISRAGHDGPLPPPPPPLSAGFTVIIRVLVVVPQSVATVISTLKVPVVVAVPERVLVEVARDSHEGRDEVATEMRVVVALTPVVVAEIVYEKDWFTFTLEESELVNSGTVQLGPPPPPPGGLSTAFRLTVTASVEVEELLIHSIKRVVGVDVAGYQRWPEAIGELIPERAIPDWPVGEVIVQKVALREFQL